MLVRKEITSSTSRPVTLGSLKTTEGQSHELTRTVDLGIMYGSLYQPLDLT
jgi:hypothetical protein